MREEPQTKLLNHIPLGKTCYFELEKKKKKSFQNSHSNIIESQMALEIVTVKRWAH